MRYPYNTANRYFTASEQKHIDEFLERGFSVEHIYKNGSGERRMICTIRLPAGLLTKDTIFDPRTPSGARNYHTPLASHNDTTALLLYNDEAGKMHRCDSLEWMKWLGRDFTVENVSVPREDPSAQKEREAILKKYIQTDEDEAEKASVEKEVIRQVKESRERNTRRSAK